MHLILKDTWYIDSLLINLYYLIGVKGLFWAYLCFVFVLFFTQGNLKYEDNFGRPVIMRYYLIILFFSVIGEYT